MSDQPLDLGAIKARHQPAGPRYCNSCGGTSWPCETYQLAVRAEESDRLTAALVDHFKRAETAEARLTLAEAENLRHRQRATCSCVQKRRDPAPGQHHRMSCRNYVGPLEHKMSFTGINGTFGGGDFDCVCGGWFRQGGSAGHGDGSETADVVCPYADQDWRGPTDDKAAE